MPNNGITIISRDEFVSLLKVSIIVYKVLVN